MTRYFVSQSGEWYRRAPNGAVHVLEITGLVHKLSGPPLDFDNLLDGKAIKETTKDQWIQACRWFRKFPGSFISD